jgi:hypothetical protein
LKSPAIAQNISRPRLIVEVGGTKDNKGEIAEAWLLGELYAGFLDLIQSLRSGRPLSRLVRKGN